MATIEAHTNPSHSSRVPSQCVASDWLYAKGQSSFILLDNYISQNLFTTLVVPGADNSSLTHFNLGFFQLILVVSGRHTLHLSLLDMYVDLRLLSLAEQ